MGDEQYITVSIHAVFTPCQCCHLAQRKVAVIIACLVSLFWFKVLITCRSPMWGLVNKTHLEEGLLIFHDHPSSTIIFIFHYSDSEFWLLPKLTNNLFSTAVARSGLVAECGYPQINRTGVLCCPSRRWQIPCWISNLFRIGCPKMGRFLGLQLRSEISDPGTVSAPQKPVIPADFWRRLFFSNVYFYLYSPI